MPITINGLTGISGADGSAATPFIRGSDADTGLYFPSAGNAAISINGTQTLLVDNSNNVTMTGNLTVAGTATVTGATTLTGNVTANGTLTVGGAAVVAVAPTAIGNIPFSTNGTTWSSTAKIVQGTSVSTATTSFTGATVGANTALTASSVTGTIAIGQVIAGTGIATGTTITAGSGTSWTISPASTGTVSGTITVVGVDFLSIPSWVKRVTVMFNGVSTNGAGTSSFLVQIGSGSVVSTGYVSQSGLINNANQTSTQNSTSGFIITNSMGNSSIINGHVIFTVFSGTTWVSSHVFGGLDGSSGNICRHGGGVSPSLSGALDRIRITTVNGTDTFDAGSINILYE
jgi:hypothetical protein